MRRQDGAISGPQSGCRDRPETLLTPSQLRRVPALPHKHYFFMTPSDPEMGGGRGDFGHRSPIIISRRTEIGKSARETAGFLPREHSLQAAIGAIRDQPRSLSARNDKGFAEESKPLFFPRNAWWAGQKSYHRGGKPRTSFSKVGFYPIAIHLEISRPPRTFWMRRQAMIRPFVAFSRAGDPPIGEFEDAVVIESFGEVPSLDDILSGE